MTDPMTLQCPRCGFRQRVPRDRIPAAARRASCPQCRHTFLLAVTDTLAPQTSAASGRTLGQLFDQTWTIYRERWQTLLPLLLASYLAVALPTAGGALAGLAAGAFWPAFDGRLVVLGALAGLGLGMLAMFWAYAAFIIAVIDRSLGIRAALAAGRALVGPYLWALSISSLLILGGLLCFVVPGILFTVWFVFLPFVVAETEARGHQALQRSYQLVRGDWWPICGKFLIAALVPSAIGVIPLVGPLLSLAAVPFTMIMLHLIYCDQKAHREVLLPAGPRLSLLWWGLALVGYALVIIPLAVWFARGGAPAWPGPDRPLIAVGQHLPHVR